MYVLICGQVGCEACLEAIELCKDYGLQYVYNTDKNRHEISEMARKQIYTVPQIFIVENGFSEYLGAGVVELESWIDEQRRMGNTKVT